MTEKTLKERWTAPTPKFWKKVQRWALITSAVAGIVLAAPVTLPAAVITTATYIATVSATIATTSQLTIDDKKIEEIEIPK
jgi:lipopolysaccharide/colanic/teichoic acid biosynthesis glycosyltransferase